jgi:hypothetical protein
LVGWRVVEVGAHRDGAGAEVGDVVGAAEGLCNALAEAITARGYTVRRSPSATVGAHAGDVTPWA